MSAFLVLVGDVNAESSIAVNHWVIDTSDISAVAYNRELNSRWSGYVGYLTESDKSEEGQFGADAWDFQLTFSDREKLAFGVDAEFWRGDERVRNDSYGLFFEFTAQRWSARVEHRGQQQKLTIRGANDLVRLRDIDSHATGIEFYWFVNDVLDVSIRYRQHTHDSIIERFNPLTRPIFLQSLSFYSFSELINLTDVEGGIGFVHYAGDFTYALDLARYKSVLDPSYTDAQLIWFDYTLNEHWLVGFEVGSQKSEGASSTTHYGISAQFYW